MLPFSRANIRRRRRFSNQTLEMQRRVLGTGHRDTLSSLGALADVYWATEQISGGRDTLHTEVLDIQRRVVGLEHPDTLAIHARICNRLL